MICFTESCMAFALPEDTCCHLEKSEIYQHLTRHAVSSVECVALHHLRGKERILFIEAKKSAPNPSNPASEATVRTYMESLKKKYEHSIQLCYAALHGRMQPELPIGRALLQALKKPQEIVFLLVAKDLRKEWCVQIQDILQRELKHLRHIWQAKVLVIDAPLAVKYRLIVEENLS